MDHFELVSEYKPTGDQPEAIRSWLKDFGKETNVRHCLELPAPERHLQWQTSLHS